MAFKLHPYVNIGDKVIVVDGPLQGAVGYYICPNYDKGKLILSLLICLTVPLKLR